jgi:hypothetical protein
MKKWSLSLALVSLCACITGCGSGGGNNLPATNTERSTVAKTAAGGASNISGLVNLSNIANPNGASTFSAAVSRAARGRAPFVTEIARLSLSARSQATGRAQLSYDSALGLYYSIVTSNNGLTTTINFYTDSNGTQPDGSAQGVQSSANSYPMTISLSLNIPSIPASGSLKTVVNNSAGTSGTITGSMTVAGTAVTNLNFTVNTDSQGNQTLSGGYAITSSIGTITYSNILENITNIENGSGVAVTANFSVGGYSGSMTVNVDGSGSMTLHDSSGSTSSVAWTSSGAATITYPDGSTGTFNIQQ